MPKANKRGATNYPATVKEILAITDLPVVSINHESFVTYLNKKFEDTYGWSNKDLQGKSITAIMPEQMRNTHMVGFARFVVTEQPRVLGKPLRLSVLCKNGETKDMELYIVGEKNKNRQWRFAATLRPL